MLLPYTETSRATDARNIQRWNIPIVKASRIRIETDHECFGAISPQYRKGRAAVPMFLRGVVLLNLNIVVSLLHAASIYFRLPSRGIGKLIWISSTYILAILPRTIWEFLTKLRTYKRSWNIATIFDVDVRDSECALINKYSRSASTFISKGWRTPIVTFGAHRAVHFNLFG